MAKKFEKTPTYSLSGRVIWAKIDGGKTTVGLATSKKDANQLLKEVPKEIRNLVKDQANPSKNEDYPDDVVFFIGNKLEYLNKGSETTSPVGAEAKAEFKISPKTDVAFLNLKNLTVYEEEDSDGDVGSFL